MQSETTANHFDLIVIGGGAAGYFGAIQYAERKANKRILILEKSEKVLSKVRVSGGGRCNVTHACFDPQEMTGNYPRGNKELLGPFHRFLCGDMMAWLSEHNVETKIESDGRVFPVSDNSESIIRCFENCCHDYKIKIKTGCAVQHVFFENNIWNLKTANENYSAFNILFATGSSNAAWQLLKDIGHTIIPPVPSLFTFNIQHHLLTGLQGIAIEKVYITIPETTLQSEGPLLITHWGLSGPAILKLSAWAARVLAEKNYRFNIHINFCAQDAEVIRNTFQLFRTEHGKRNIILYPLFNIPKRLWQRMAEILKTENLNYGSLNTKQTDAWVQMLCACNLPVNGKSVFKEEFVTCGGVDTKEINFTTMESKLFPGLYFAGEVLNIDAVTGGFNFQAAWTGAYIAAEAIAAKHN
ncbi:MAG: NAD(P)/FAD-dependent oxidoreductase [Bacteroidetes bacterium]|nr:NAD(P)/FAD-dependent oxidoreductase [Bacteroidota bacterium]